MATVKAGRNKTIDTPLSEGQIYLDRCIAVTQRQVDLGGVLDKTVIGDMLDVCSLLPPKSIDLIIADPPYNLTKSFNGTTFTKKKEADYEEYTRQWLSAIKPLLKDDASIYVCCDWETSLIVGKVGRLVILHRSCAEITSRAVSTEVTSCGSLKALKIFLKTLSFCIILTKTIPLKKILTVW